MEYRTLGRTGVMVSALCLGAMNFGAPTDEEEATAIVNDALEQGINFIDTAMSITTARASASSAGR